MEYIKLFWEDAPEGEPPVILYEVDTDNERLALRSIDIFADGSTHNCFYLSANGVWLTKVVPATYLKRLEDRLTPN